VAVDENIGNQANNNNNDIMMMGLIDAAADEYIDYQANDNESHPVVDDPVGDIPDDIGAVENIENQEDNNNDNHDVVDAPVGNVTEQLFDETANENIGIMANNEENYDVVVLLLITLLTLLRWLLLRSLRLLLKPLRTYESMSMNGH
jgi:hypothetical protein